MLREVSIVTAVNDGALRQLRADKKEDEIKMAIEGLFAKASGFTLTYNDVTEEGMITITTLRMYKLWSPEYYTHRSDAKDLPVETVDSGTL